MQRARHPHQDHTRQQPTGPPSPQMQRDLVVQFDNARATLLQSEQVHLRRWVRSWRRDDPDAMVVMACSTPVARPARVQRLRQIRQLLRDIGISEDRIRYTGDLIATDAPADALRPDPQVMAHDAATLKMVSALNAGREVRAIRSYFRPPNNTQEATCASAS